MSYPELLTAEEKLADAKDRLGIPPIVVICGSTRFWQEMADAAWAETLAGRIVVRPDVDMKRPGSGYVDAAAVKVDLDMLHRAKIRIADDVLVVGDYIGDSTRSEIAYARSLGKPVRFTHPEVEYATTPCDFVACEPGGEPCSTHERLMAHAEGEHELCGIERGAEVGPRCGNNPNVELSPGDQEAVNEFKAYLQQRQGEGR